MSDVSQLEAQRRDAVAQMKRRDLALQLEKVPAFKELIIDGFMERDCARYARESGDPTLSAAQREDALAMAQAAGHLKRFLSIMVIMGNNAEGSITGIDDALDEIRAEGGDD